MSTVYVLGSNYKNTCSLTLLNGNTNSKVGEPSYFLLQGEGVSMPKEMGSEGLSMSGWGAGYRETICFL